MGSGCEVRNAEFTRRRLLTRLGELSAVGAAASLISQTGPAGATGTDRGMSYTVAASNAGAPFAGNADAQCDGTADEVEINAAIDLVGTSGGGTVELSRGTFLTGAPIIMRSNVTLRGQGASLIGQLATRIERTGNHVLVRAKGSGPGGGSTHIHGVRIRDLELNGADLGATGIEIHYADSTIINGVLFGQIYGHAIEAVEWWDSYITDCRFEYCGSRDGSGVPSVGLYGARPGLPTVYATNGIRMSNCMFETFADGALALVGSGSGGEQVNVCFIENTRFETQTLRGVPVRLDRTTACMFRNVQASVGPFENQTQPQDAFTVTNTSNLSIDGYYAQAQNVPGQSVRTLLALKGGNFRMSLHDLMFDVGTTNKPTVAALEFSGTNEFVDLGYHGFGFDGSGTAVLRVGDTTKKYRSSGSAAIAAAANNVVVTHNLGKTPNLADISVTPTKNPGSATKFWVDTPTATTFRIRVNTAPGGTGASFAWQAEAF